LHRCCHVTTKQASALFAAAVSLAAAGCGTTRATSPTPKAHPSPAVRWVTGWEAPAVVASGPGFSDQTLRMIVTPHAAGSEARVVLSNLFGSRPVTISAATIARQASGPALAAGTVRPLTFQGRRSVTIAAGQQTQSDPAMISLTPFEDVAVSLAFRSPTGSPTNHFNGLQTSYYTPAGSGDQTGSIDGTAFTGGTPSRFFLSAVQVLAPATAKTIVAAGDSITDGGVPEADTVNQNARWPDFLQRRLLAAGSKCSVADAGISGNQVTHSGPPNKVVGGPSLESRLERDVLSQPSLGGIILAEGLNDIGLEGTPADRLIAGLVGIARRARRAGVPIFIATLTPIQGGIYGPAAEPIRTAVNNWIRSQHVFDGVIDFAKAVQDPSDPARLLPAYDSGDHLHPDARGFAAMAQSINLDALRRIVGC
jgi:lysophospholipase L1-like esterase